MSDQQTSIPSASDTLSILCLATGFWLSQALFVAVKLGGKKVSWATLLDLQMLVLTLGGRERSEAGYAALLSSAGLSLRRIIPTAAGPSLIEASGERL